MLNKRLFYLNMYGRETAGLLYTNIIMIIILPKTNSFIGPGADQKQTPPGGGGSFSITVCMPAIQDVIAFLMYVLYLCFFVDNDHRTNNKHKL